MLDKVVTFQTQLKITVAVELTLYAEILSSLTFVKNGADNFS